MHLQARSAAVVHIGRVQEMQAVIRADVEAPDSRSGGMTGNQVPAYK